MPDISVVICTVNRADNIGAAVGSVLDNDYGAFEVVVVDQSRDETTRDALAPLLSADSRLRYIHSGRVGLSAAYNLGIAATSGGIVAFTDDDCIAPVSWIQNVVSAFAAHRDAELLYGQVLVPPELAREAGVVPSLVFAETRRLSKADGFQVFGMGANFAARRSLFRKLGGFDEVLGGGGPLRSSQDFDLQFRAYRAGVVCLLEPSVWVLHYGFREESRWPDTLTAYGVGDGAFYMKHVRCGDLLAARLVTARLARQLAGAIIRPVLRRQGSTAYMQGLLKGIRGSYRFPVDRRSRLYVMRPGAEDL